MFGKRMIEVNAILDDDIEMLLKETGQLEPLLQGKIKCISCNTTITTSNIGIIVPNKTKQGYQIDFYCERINCAERYKHDAE